MLAPGCSQDPLGSMSVVAHHQVGMTEAICDLQNCKAGLQNRVLNHAYSGLRIR